MRSTAGPVPGRPIPRVVLAVVAGALVAAGATGAAWWWHVHRERAAATVPATYVGRQACASCHADADRRWQSSHHALAMQRATPASVAGDFNDTRFTYAGTTSTFFRRDGKFMVRTD